MINHKFIARTISSLVVFFLVSVLSPTAVFAGGWWQIGSSLDPFGNYWWDQGAAELVISNTTIPFLPSRLTTNSSADIQPSFQPPGYGKLAFSSNRDGNYEIYIGTLNGGKTAFTAQNRLTNEWHDDTEPAFSPDGTKIAFTTNRDGNNEIYVGTLDGPQTSFSSLVRLTSNGDDDREPAFSNDGSKIVFSSNSDGDYEIYSMNAADGSGVAQLTTNTAQDRQPKWSLATIGGVFKIAYTTNSDGDYDIHQMNTDGSADAALAGGSNSIYADIQPSYSPTASNIAFATDRDGTGGASYEIYNMTNAGVLVAPPNTIVDGSTYVDFMPSYDTGKVAMTTNRYSISGIIYSSPHGNYSTSSNLCKTCHAVHEAGVGSYRLLKNGTAVETRSPGEGSAIGMGNLRATECMYCHDGTSGSSAKKPYILGVLASPKGEHTIGATLVPDSNINGGSGDLGNLPNRDPSGEGAVLQCYQCHSVHGANTIGGPEYSATGWVVPATWNRKILRLDPSGDGVDMSQSDTGTPAGDYGVSAEAVRSGWCSDCHNLNPNWMYWQSGTDADYLNLRSHPINTDGQMEVYGDFGVGGVGIEVSFNPAYECQTCHIATVGAGAGTSRFPHQSLGHKLLRDQYTTSAGEPDSWYTGDPGRPLPSMDYICLGCHQLGGTGVGYTF